VPAFEKFPRPPGQSTIRLLPGTDGDGIVLTNRPHGKALDLAYAVGSSTGYARLGSLLLLLGVVFVAGALISIWVVDQPLKVNGRPAGKWEGTAVTILFGAVWTGVAYWIQWGRRGSVSSPFTLTLRDDRWEARDALGHVLGRCRPGDVERVSVDFRRCVIVEFPRGRAILSGSLPGHDAQWLQEALARDLGLRSDPAGASGAFPFVPTLPTQFGERLAHRLRGERDVGGCLGTLTFALLWTGITGVFVWLIVKDPHRGPPDWFATLFHHALIPFVAIGLLVVVAFVVGILGSLSERMVRGRRGGTVLELASHPLVAGESCRAFLRQDGSYIGYAMVVLLVCEEQATYGQKTDFRTDTKTVQEFEVFRAEALDLHLGDPFEREFDLHVPGAAMHSFAASHNRIGWKLVVHGGRSADRNPRGLWVRARTFPVVVQPARSEEPLG
jgi:hypothetical protein